MAKATIGIVAVSALAASTSVPDTIAGLARVGVRRFRQLLALSARQLQVLRADLGRIRQAVAVRTASPRRAVASPFGARSLGSLFVRSTERADTLRLAAELRGGDATTPLAAVAIPPARRGGRLGAGWSLAGPWSCRWCCGDRPALIGRQRRPVMTKEFGERADLPARP